MAVNLIMPKLGLTMEEGTVVRWLVAAGDRVKKGQPVLEVETDKVVIEVEATASGQLGPLLVNEGQTVPITTLLARIYAPGEKIPRQEQLAEKTTPPAQKPEVGEALTPRFTPVARRMAEKEHVDLSNIRVHGPGARIRARDVEKAYASREQGQKKRPAGRSRGSRTFSSPRARQRAKELGVDWQILPGSGPQGRVVEKDVLQAATHPLPPPFRGSGEGVVTGQGIATGEEFITWETPGTVQRITAQRMAASFGGAPHFYLSVEVRADALLDLRTRLLPLIEKRTGVRLTITDLMVRILGTALAEHPRANAFWDEGRLGLHRQVNVGVAVATSAGLVVPVLRQVDRKSLSDIVSERAKLVAKARDGALSVDDLSGGTFTLTNLGMFRVDAFQAILNPPQSAILAMGRIVERPAVVDGQLAVCPTVVLTLSCDHRVLDGALAAQFLGRVVDLVEEPYGLLT